MSAAIVALCLATSFAAFGGTASELRFISVPGKVPNGSNGDCDTAAFVKVIEVGKPVERAVWTVSGLGVFRVWLNGGEVGADDFLKPGYTHVRKRRLSFSYDVSTLLKSGRNVLAAEVSTGWWRDGIVGGRRGAKSGFGGNLEIEYKDGSKDVVSTDESWKAAYVSPAVHAEIYWGERFDARVVSLWQTPDDPRWKPAQISGEFKGAVTPVKEYGQTIFLRKDLALKPREMYVWRGVDGASKTAHGKVRIVRRYSDGDEVVLGEGERLVVDFGQNAAGVPRIVASAAAGVALNGRSAEMLNDCNGLKSRGNDGPEGSAYFANYRSARSSVNYIFAGKGKETYRPSLTFFGGRYFSFTASGKVAISSIGFIPVMSIASENETGRLETGHEDLNRLISNCVWGMRSNYLSVPTDCPQRNERWG